MSTYNGWANIETWRVQLHLANDCDEEGFVSAVAGLYASKYADTPPTEADFLPPTFAEYLRGFVWERSGANEVGGRTFQMFARDVVAAALERVDWDQLARHWMEPAAEPTT